MKLTPPVFFARTVAMIALGMAAMLLAWTGIVTAALPKGELPSNHKWFLLANAPSDVIVIDGGSSGHHGLSARMIGDAFGRPAINVSDSASYQWSDKALRLDEVLGEDASLVMSMEWNHAFRERPSDVYLNHIGIHNTDYFTGLPLLSKLTRSLNFSPKRVYELIRNPSDDLMAKDWGRFGHIRHRLASPTWQYGSSTFAAGERDLLPSNKRHTCDSYLSLRTDPPVVTESFRDALRTLAAMRDRGVDVEIIWPPVVGDDCYTELDFTQRENAIREAAADFGFTIQGKPQDSSFPTRYRDNTFYHLDTKGQALFTEQTIQKLGRLAKRDIDPQARHAAQMDHYNAALARYEAKVDAKYIGSASPMIPGVWYFPADAGMDGRRNPVRIAQPGRRTSRSIAMVSGQSRLSFRLPVKGSDAEHARTSNCIAIRFENTPSETAKFLDAAQGPLPLSRRDGREIVLGLSSLPKDGVVTLSLDGSDAPLMIMGVSHYKDVSCSGEDGA